MKAIERKRGSALLMVLGFMVIVTLLAAAVLTAASSVQRITDRQVNTEKAMFVAEAGVESAAHYIEQQGGYIGTVAYGSGSSGDGDWDYTISRIDFRTYSIDTTGRVNNVSKAIAIDRVYLPTYATYALWMHENGQIYFIPGEEFFGHIHSNDKLWFYSNAGDGGPEFWGAVSSGASTYGGSIEWVEFHKGFELDASEGTMANVDFGELKGFAQTYGVVLSGKTTIEFQGGDLRIWNSRKGWSNEKYTLGEDELLYVKRASSGPSSTKKAKVILKGGNVDGRLTIVAEDDIKITDHIRYADDPAVNPDSNDALGLISKDDVWVTTAAPDDLDIYAAIMATGIKSPSNRGSFGVLEYWDQQVGPRGALEVYGGIVQDKRGAVGTFNSNGPVSGYYKNYTYDTRFELEAPPFYPAIGEKIRFQGWRDGPAG